MGCKVDGVARVSSPLFTCFCAWLTFACEIASSILHTFGAFL